jgi:hypothetical protein
LYKEEIMDQKSVNDTKPDSSWKESYKVGVILFIALKDTARAKAAIGAVTVMISTLFITIYFIS